MHGNITNFDCVNIKNFHFKFCFSLRSLSNSEGDLKVWSVGNLQITVKVKSKIL